MTSGGAILDHIIARLSGDDVLAAMMGKDPGESLLEGDVPPDTSFPAFSVAFTGDVPMPTNQAIRRQDRGVRLTLHLRARSSRTAIGEGLATPDDIVDRAATLLDGHASLQAEWSVKTRFDGEPHSWSAPPDAGRLLALGVDLMALVERDPTFTQSWPPESPTPP